MSERERRRSHVACEKLVKQEMETKGTAFQEEKCNTISDWLSLETTAFESLYPIALPT